MKEKIKRLLRKVLAMLPSRLPSGVSEFEAWSVDIIDLYEAPNNDSIRFALATMILHAGAQDAYKSKHFFGISLRKSMANQVAAAVMQDLKTKQQEAIAREAAAKEAAEKPSETSV